MNASGKKSKSTWTETTPRKKRGSRHNSLTFFKTNLTSISSSYVPSREKTQTNVDSSLPGAKVLIIQHGAKNIVHPPARPCDEQEDEEEIDERDYCENDANWTKPISISLSDFMKERPSRHFQNLHLKSVIELFRIHI
jgi:hypothetical protein